ncbi:hypothetical protein NDU88_005335 [Pleurodeles waltl]|uniref:Uncharacterized protein n=1 Tax=Pleurodeles waltl TaxID=8319 RepID=A0AAV7V3T0_PLEWA|nr:hypothetical protein NDU88_005335 [Pleurodeles waltl]
MGALMKVIAEQGDGPVDPLAAHTLQILEAIKDTKHSLEEQITTVVIEVGLLQGDHKTLLERVRGAVAKITVMQPTVKELSTKCVRMERKFKMLTDRVEDAESRAHRHNVCLVGVPEGKEGPSLELMEEKWLVESVLKGQPSKCFSVERAHRKPIRRQNPGVEP